MNRRHIYIMATLLWCLLLISPSFADDLDTASLTAKQILERMANTYAHCKSYRDSGVVKVVTDAHKGKNVKGHKTEEIHFTTAFVRPDRFRFEDKRAPADHRLYNSGIVWRKGDEVKVWPDLLQLLQSKMKNPEQLKKAQTSPLFKRPMSFAMAVATETGVSNEAADTIPCLLLPGEVKSWRLTQMADARRTENTDADYADCFRLVGSWTLEMMDMHRQITVWIDKKTFLVRRIDQQGKWKFDGIDFIQQKTTTYVPEIDVDIPEDSLVFNPPTTPTKPTAK